MNLEETTRFTIGYGKVIQKAKTDRMSTLILNLVRFEVELRFYRLSLA